MSHIQIFLCFKMHTGRIFHVTMIQVGRVTLLAMPVTYLCRSSLALCDTDLQSHALDNYNDKF